MFLPDWVWAGGCSFQPTIVSLRDLQGSTLFESLLPAFESSHEQLALPISARGRTDLTNAATVLKMPRVLRNSTRKIDPV
jgi:hypothetical protein